MDVDLSVIRKFNRIGVAVSGGSDSMALLHFLHTNSKLNGYSVIAINVEHGIRGKSSVADSEFVFDYCKKNNIELLSYKVNSVKKSIDDKISIEQSARELRYKCFFDAINSGKCDVIATAHHLKDNFETVLINLFRGTGIKGLAGITNNDKIIRPFINLTKKEILDYLKENSIPFVTDETNLSDDITRNFIRHNVIPKIEEVFPEAEKSVFRLSLLSKKEDDFLDKEAEKLLETNSDTVSISINSNDVLLSRAIIIALKKLGIEKDWEKKHVDDVVLLSKKQNGKHINLLSGISAYKEYDKILLTKTTDKDNFSIPFTIGKISFKDNCFSIDEVKESYNLKTGLFFDANKIPNGAVIRTKHIGDMFTKFGGGTKSLSDYLTDKKIPLRERNNLLLIANGNEILGILGLSISDKIKIDEKTKKIYKITKE